MFAFYLIGLPLCRKKKLYFFSEAKPGLFFKNKQLIFIFVHVHGGYLSDGSPGTLHKTESNVLTVVKNKVYFYEW